PASVTALTWAAPCACPACSKRSSACPRATCLGRKQPRRQPRGGCTMSTPEPLRVGFVVKRYPRYSETFVVREILAHEEAGASIDIFVLRPTIDGHFQDLIARVRGAVQYLYFPTEGRLPEDLASATLRADSFWEALGQAAEVLPGFWPA